MRHARSFLLATLSLSLAACPGEKKTNEKALQASGAGAPVAAGLGEVTTVLSVTLQGAGVEAQRGGAWSAQRIGQPLAADTVLRTAAGIRARISLRDGTVLHLNESTQLQLQGARALRLQSGELLAEVAPGEKGKAPLVIETAAGRVRVTGTKLNVRAEPSATIVDVTRGTVEVAGAGSQVEVGAGEQAVVKTGAAPRVGLSRDLAEATRWSRELGVTPGSAQSLQPGIGSLQARVPAWGGSRPSVALRLASQQVRVTMHDNLARTEIEQSWYNGSNDTLEGTYRFPLPPGASISRLALYVGNKLEEGEIIERQRARQIFRKIVEDTIRPRDPALLEWVGGRVFQMKIFPIPPRSARRVILGYTQLLPASHGKVRYVYPMSVGRGQAMRVGKFAVDMRVSSARGLPKVSAPLYPVLTEQGNDAVRLRYEASEFTPAASFVVQAAPASDPPELQLALYEPPNRGQVACAVEAPQLQDMDRIPAPGIRDVRRRALPTCGDRGGFFMAVLRPELPTTGRAKPRDYLFLLDSSHSTGKHGWAVQLGALEAFLAEMDMRSRFTVMACDAACKNMGDSFVRPTAETRQAALRFARAVVPGGSSNLQAAFEDAAAFAVKAGVAPHVIYLGDGRPSAGELREPELARLVVTRLEKAKASLDALQIGEDVSELFLAHATRRLGGAVHRINAGDDVGERVFEIVAAQYRPTLTDLEVSFESLDVHHVYPASLETLTAGSEATIVGRYGKGGQGALRVRGKLAGAPFERRYPVNLVAEKKEEGRQQLFISRLWAKHHLDALTFEDYARNRAEIVRVSKAYTVLSRATAFLVLENEQMWREFGISRTKKSKDFAGKVAVRDGRDQAERKSAGPGYATAAGEKKKESAAPEEEQAQPRGDSASGADKASDDLDSLSAGDEARAPAKAARVDVGEPRAEPSVTTPAPTMAREAPAKMAPRAKRSMSRPMPMDRLGSVGGGRSAYYRPPELRVTIQPLLSVPARAHLERLTRSLEAQLATYPLRRALHRSLHRALMQTASYEEALRHAEKWAELDASHAAALRALADVQAIQTGPEVAMRSYASTVDIEPGSTRRHQQLAEMYRNKGDLRRSCAHLWSLHALAPRTSERALVAARCLAGIGPEGREAAEALLTNLLASKLAARDTARVAKALSEIRAGSVVPPVAGARGGAITAQATWNQPVDLDVAIILPSGDRISALQGRAGASAVDSHDGRSAEIVRLATIADGAYRIEISRPAGGKASDAVTGTLLVQAKGKSQVVPFVMSEGTKPLAQVTIANSGALRRFPPRPMMRR